MSEGEHHTDLHKESPQGVLASKLGVAAVHALSGLRVETEWRGGVGRRWGHDDHAAFHSTLALLFELKMARSELVIREDGPDSEPKPIYDDEEGMPLDHHVDIFQCALPFDEGERDWVGWHYGSTRNIIREIRWYGRKEPAAVALTAGRWQRFAGQDMLDRWWDWRRGIGDYEGQNSREIACNALRGMGSILVPNYPLPPAYRLPRTM